MIPQANPTIPSNPQHRCVIKVECCQARYLWAETALKHRCVAR